MLMAKPRPTTATFYNSYHTTHYNNQLALIHSVLIQFHF